MQYVRLLHPKHFDCQLDEFKSLAFRDSGNGASVIQHSCIDATGSTVCAHVRRYYPDVGGEPPIFLVFDEADLPADSRLIKKRSTSGDDCHHDITGPNINSLNKSLKKLLKGRHFSSFAICANGHSRPLERADICENENNA